MNRTTILRKAIAAVEEIYNATVIDCYASNDDEVELTILCGGYEPARVKAYPNSNGDVDIYFK